MLRKLFLLQYAFLAIFIAAFGTVAFAFLMVDFQFPGEFRPWYLTAQNGLEANALLLLVFGLQHSIMARDQFKRAWVRLIPKELERSTYVMFSGFFLLLVSTLWSPVLPELYDFRGTPFGYFLTGMAIAGVIITVLGVMIGSALDLIGVRHIVAVIRDEPYQPPSFKLVGLYKYIRHPLYAGLIMIFWFSPTMTPDHLLFAVVMTLYIQIGIHYEEQDLVRLYGQTYEDYRARVPKLLPFRVFGGRRSG